jgi:hypothetical protein
LLTSYNGQAITYDAIGNPLTYRDNMSFTWDGRQMRSVKKGDVASSYTYNNDGIRTSKTVGGVTTKYFLDGSTVLAQQTGNDILWCMYDSDGTRVGFTYNGTANLTHKGTKSSITRLSPLNFILSMHMTVNILIQKAELVPLLPYCRVKLSGG